MTQDEVALEEWKKARATFRSHFDSCEMCQGRAEQLVPLCGLGSSFAMSVARAHGGVKVKMDNVEFLIDDLRNYVKGGYGCVLSFSEAKALLDEFDRAKKLAARYEALQ